MAVDSVSSLTPLVFTFSTPAEVNSVGEVLITPANLAAPASDIPNDSEVSGDTVGDALDTLDTAVQAAQADANLVWVTVGIFSVDIGIVPSSILVPAPVTGTLTRVMAIADQAPDAAISVATSIGGAPVTNGTATIELGEGATVKSATPTAANATTLGTTAVLVTPTSSNTVTIQMTVMLGFTRA